MCLLQSYTQKRPPRNRADSDTGGGKPPGGSGGSRGPPGGSGGGSDGSGNEAQHSTRPRGTSDARFRTKGEPTGVSTSGYRKFSHFICELGA